MPGYSLEDIAALKAVPASDAKDGHSLLIKNDTGGKPAWYTFIEANQEIDDDDLVLVPNDNPNNGRWLKTNISSVNSSGNTPNPSIISTRNAIREIPKSSQVSIDFNNTLINTLNGFDGTTFTSPFNGVYRVFVSLDLGNNLDSPNYLSARIWLGGNLNGESELNLASVVFPGIARSELMCLNSSLTVLMRENDFFTVYASLTGQGSSGSTVFVALAGRLFIEKLSLVYA